MKRYTEIAYFLVDKKLSGKEKKNKKKPNHFTLLMKMLCWHFLRCQVHFSILQKKQGVRFLNFHWNYYSH